MKEPPQIQVPAAKGLNTYAARGSTDAPHVLRNAVLRPGGWACAPRDRFIRAGVTHALYAGRASELFVQVAGVIEHYDPLSNPAFTVLPTTRPAATLTGALPVGPGLAYTDVAGEGVYIHPDFGVRPVLHAATLTEWNGVGGAPSGPWYRRHEGGSAFPANVATSVRLVPIRGPDAPKVSPYQGVTEIVLPVTSGTRGLSFGNIDWPVNIYFSYSPGSEPQFLRANLKVGTGELVEDFVLPNSELIDSPVATSTMYIQPRAAEYHQSRVFAAGTARRYDPKAVSPMVVEEHANRLYFSEVIANFTAEALPFFAEDYWFDVPFRASRGITALQAAGRYLYVFGEREVMLLTGTDDSNWTLESVGDSIGAISAASVQRIQNAVIYLSDSGVLLLSGGQVQDVSGDVRDLVLGLDRGTLTSTVDFAQEQYLISDGVTTLVYHLREQGWTQRDPDGSAQRLAYGGGVPYSLHGNFLAALDSPLLRTMRVTLGPFGTPRQRRVWHGITCAVDADVAGEFVVALRGRDVNFERGMVDVATAEQTRPTAPGVTPVTARVGTADGVILQSALVEVDLTLTPGTLSRRCILRPPLEVVGDVGTEAWS